MHVRLDDDRHSRQLTFPHLVEHVVQLGGLLQRQFGFARLRLTELSDLACLALVLDDKEVVTGTRRLGQTENHRRLRRSGFLDGGAGLIEHVTNAAILFAGDDHIALLERAGLHQQRSYCATSLLQAGLDDETLGRALGNRREIHDLGLQQDRIEQFVDTLARVGRNIYELLLAAPVLGDNLVLGQLVLDALRIGVFTVDLVDRHDERYARRLRMLDRLNRLGHDTVISSHNQDNNIRRLRAACAHRREGRVARCIEERDHALVGRDRVRADVLRDTASFTRSHLGMADVIEQGGLAVVDVSHDRHDRCTPYLVAAFLNFFGQQLLVHLGRIDRLRHVTELFDDERRRVLVDNLVDRHHGAHVEQDLDDFITLDRHCLGQIGNRNTVRNLDLADDWRRRTLEAVLIAADRHRAPTNRRLALASTALVARDVQFLATVLGLRRLLLRLGFFFILGTASSGISLGFLDALFLLGSIGGSLFSSLASLFLRLLALFFLALLGFLLGLGRSLFLSRCALALGLLGCNPLFFLEALGVKRFLIFLRLLFEDVPLDVRTFAAYLNVDRARAALRCRTA